MPKYTATLFADGRSLGDHGFAVDDVAGWFSPAPRQVMRTRIPGRAGAAVTRIEEGEKELRVSGHVVGSSLADRNTLLDEVASILARGAALRLERTDVSGRTVATGWLEGQPEVVEGDPRMASRHARLAFRLVTSSAYIEDAAPLPYSFGATRTAMPLGTAAVAPLLRIVGSATNPIVRLRNLAGDVLAAVTFTITLTINDWLDIDCSSYRIDKYLTGAKSDGYSTYAGNADNLPILDPADGDYLNGAWPTLEVTAGLGVAIYARSWR